MSMIFPVTVRHVVGCSHVYTHGSILVALRYMVSRFNTWKEIQEETENVEGKRKRHDPLENGGDVGHPSEVGHHKDDCEREFD